MNNTADSTPSLQRTPANTGVLILSTTCIALSIGANALILICFYRNRQKTWRSFTRLTFSMAVSDLLVGVNAIPFVVRDMVNGVMHATVCTTSIYMAFSTQIISLFHVFGICILRSIKIYNANSIGNENQEKKYATMIIIVSWLCPSLVIAVPFILWGTFSAEKIFCQTGVVFGANAVRFKIFISSFYFTVQCLTNILYLALVLKLWLTSRKKVTPVAMKNDLNPETTARNSNAMNSGQGQITSSAIKSQKQAAVTIGLLLMLFNLFTLPTSVSLFLGGNFKNINNSLIYVVVTLFIANSGLNAIVYTTRVSTIRESAKELIEDGLKFLRIRR